MGNIKEVLVMKKAKTDKNIWTKREEKKREARRKEEPRGELRFVCHLLLMRHMWAALETMSHAHNGTVAPIGSEQAPSVKDDCVGVCYSTADFSLVIEWLSTIYRSGLPFGQSHSGVMYLTMWQQPCTREKRTCPGVHHAYIDLWSVTIRWAELYFYRHTHKEKCNQTHQRAQPLPSFHVFLPSSMAFLFFSPAG